MTLHQQMKHKTILEAIQTHIKQALPHCKIEQSSNASFEILLGHISVCRIIIHDQTITYIEYINHYRPYQVDNNQPKTIDLAHPQSLQKLINTIAQSPYFAADTNKS